MKTSEVNAVHEDDALALLDLLGVGIDYHAGRLRCVICEVPLMETELGAARRTAEGAYEFSCDRLDCLDEFHVK